MEANENNLEKILNEIIIAMKITETRMSDKQQRKYCMFKMQNGKIIEKDCTWEEALEKARRERELIDKHRG